MVLLKNEQNLLPLDGTKPLRLLVTGPNADEIYCQLGDYTPPVRPEAGVTVRRGLEQWAAGTPVQVAYAPGCPAFGSDPDLMEQAVEAAREAYEALTDAQKQYVTEETVTALEALENRIQELEDAEEPEQVHQETVQPEKEPEVMQETGVHPVNDLSETPASNGNTGGWEDLLGTLGLSGMGDIAGNLGYVMAMLPDILLGVFTGKTQSLNIKDNLLPIASIVAGMFVRNPLLKMLLIGLGGANLLNKAGHEVLRERSEGEMNTANRGAAQYRHYPDEPLNPRITNPVLQGNMLVATIDRVPCTIQLSQTVTDAYRAGALPLNTLANAVLARSEQLRQRASDNYDNGQQETIVRTRGIQ